MGIAANVGNTVPDSRDFPHALVDGNSHVWTIERRGAAITPWLRVTDENGNLVREERIDFPNPANTWRNSGLDIYARGSSVVIWGYVHNTVNGSIHTFEAVVPGFAPLGTASPPAPPDPVAPGLTESAIKHMIAEALVQLPAPSQGGGHMTPGDIAAIANQVAETLAQAAGDENHPYHQALANLLRTTVQPLDINALATAIATSDILYTQLNNVAGLQAWKVAIESGQVEAIGKITGTPVAVPVWVKSAIGKTQAS